MVLLEAMANGTVCIATALGGRSVEILGDTGIIVEGSAESIASGLKKVLDNDTLFEDFSDKVRERVKYDNQIVLNKWLGLFKTVMK